MDFFSESLGFSETTSYDWSTSAEETFSYSETTTVTIEAKPGKLVRIFPLYFHFRKRQKSKRTHVT